MNLEILGCGIPYEWILFGSCILCLLGFLFALIGMIVSIKLKCKYKKILKDGAGRDITEAIANYYKKCSDIIDDFQEAEERIRKLEAESKACAKKVGSIRYNAFGGNNSNLSFAAAVLDESDSGFVINGVYTRQQTTTYLKPIHNGKSLFELSEEEEEAINTAKLNYETIVNR